jgi:hypothetical protein
MIWQNAECWSTNELPSINYVGLRKKAHKFEVVVKSGTVKLISIVVSGNFFFLNNKKISSSHPKLYIIGAMA